MRSHARTLALPVQGFEAVTSRRHSAKRRQAKDSKSASSRQNGAASASTVSQVDVQRPSTKASAQAACASKAPTARACSDPG